MNRMHISNLKIKLLPISGNHWCTYPWNTNSSPYQMPCKPRSHHWMSNTGNQQCNSFPNNILHPNCNKHISSTDFAILMYLFYSCGYAMISKHPKQWFPHNFIC